MLQFRVLAHRTALNSSLPAANSLRIRTYIPPLPQPFYLHHLQAPPASVHSKAPISPAESPLTRFAHSNSFMLRTYKNTGEGIPNDPHGHSSQRTWRCSRLFTLSASPVAAARHQQLPSTPLYATLTKFLGGGGRRDLESQWPTTEKVPPNNARPTD